MPLTTGWILRGYFGTNLSMCSGRQIFPPRMTSSIDRDWRMSSSIWRYFKENKTDCLDRGPTGWLERGCDRGGRGRKRAGRVLRGRRNRCGTSWMTKLRCQAQRSPGDDRRVAPSRLKRSACSAGTRRPRKRPGSCVFVFLLTFFRGTDKREEESSVVFGVEG